MGDAVTVIVIYGASVHVVIYPRVICHIKKFTHRYGNHITLRRGLYRLGHLSPNLKIIGFSRRIINPGEFFKAIKTYCKVNIDSNKFDSSVDEELFGKFTNQLMFYSGDYQDHIFIEFDKYITDIAKNTHHNRIFYFALPPAAYNVVASCTSRFLCACQGFVRVVLEKPFGYDITSASLLNQTILGLFREEQIYRIDHYLGKDMVQNILAIRFANFVISSLWDRNHIANVLISFKEDIGTFGRGNYYDGSGVIRDIIQNHMIQVLSLLAMEPPKSLMHNDIKDAKITLLKQILPIDLKNVVIGQYTGNSAADPSDMTSKGYKDDEMVPPDSITPTFVNMILYIDNDRWRGVPFILKAGKALKERKADIRIQFKPIAENLFQKSAINELVIKMQPDEVPGAGFNMHVTELDLTYKDRHKDFFTYDAYEMLIMDLIQGSHIHFVRSDEVEESWRLLTPLLKKLEEDKVQPIPYEFGSRGPCEADELNKKVGFIYNSEYKWTK